MQIRNTEDMIDELSKTTSPYLNPEYRKQFITDFTVKLSKGEIDIPHEDYLKFICFCAIERDRASIIALPNINDYLSVKLDYSSSNADKCRNKLMNHPVRWLAYHHDDASVDFLLTIQPLNMNDLYLLYVLANRLDRFQAELKEILTKSISSSLMFSIAMFGNPAVINEMLTQFPLVTESNRLPVPYFLSNPIANLYARFINFGTPSNEPNYDWRARDVISAHRGASKKDIYKLLTEFNPENRRELIKTLKFESNDFHPNTQAVMDKMTGLMNDNQIPFEQAFLWTSLRQNLFFVLLQVTPHQSWKILPVELLIHVNSYIFDLDSKDTFSLFKSFYAIVPQKIFSDDRIQNHTLFHASKTDTQVTAVEEAPCLNRKRSAK